MISNVSPPVFAVVALCVIPQAASLLAADPNSAAALEAVAENDSSLRSALDSYEKSEGQLRERFGREVSGLKDSLIEALEKALARAASKRDTESAATLAAVINSWNNKQLGEPTIPKEEKAFVGTGLQWDNIVLFLAPNRVCWGLNKEGAWTIYRSSWKPAGVNAVRWDSGGGTMHAITIDGDAFTGRRDDGLEFRGKVFRP
jgi:hypothetical protein